MNIAFIHVMSRLLIYNEEYGKAKAMIEERIALTRSKILESDEEDASVLGDDVSQLLIWLSGKIFLTQEGMISTVIMNGSLILLAPLRFPQKFIRRKAR
jgi:hypothetical protein